MTRFSCDGMSVSFRGGEKGAAIWRRLFFFLYMGLRMSECELYRGKSHGLIAIRDINYLVSRVDFLTLTD